MTRRTSPPPSRTGRCGHSDTSGWTVVIPLKRLHLAKSRLSALPPPLRRALVVGMALDVRDAVLACPAVRDVVVVTRDPRWPALLDRSRMRFVPDSPQDSLNDALRRGVGACCNEPDTGIAALTGDLPALRPEELLAALEQAATHPLSFVSDTQQKGTTLLAARRSIDFDPRYGDSSRVRHLRGGAVELACPERSGLRQDVDTPADLAAAHSLGTGRHTTAALASDVLARVGGSGSSSLWPALAPVLQR